MSKESKLHKLLIRQLKRYGFTLDALPQTLEVWVNFIEKISEVYQQTDEERYLNERSVEISSRELIELNRKLEHAQKIAKLGYWFYDKVKNSIYFSKELCNLLEIPYEKNRVSLVQASALLHQDDFSVVNNVAQEIIRIPSEHTLEIRMKTTSGSYRWFQVVCRPQEKQEKEEYEFGGIAIDITAQKANEIEIAKLNQELLKIARQAGMADIATSILHNVGNILNSASVSIELLQESLSKPYLKKLSVVVSMLKEHASALTEYLVNDPKGKLIPDYIMTVSSHMEHEQQRFVEEVKNLEAHIKHIKNVVIMQQTVASVSGFKEKVFLPEIIDMAIQMNTNTFHNKPISVEKTYTDTTFILTDKSKLLHIILNLLRNASESVMENDVKEKKHIQVLTKRNVRNNTIDVTIKDNGVGILPENMTNIFSFGYSSKKNGHGFGLHSSAVSAKELGGNLSVESEGAGKGASFIISLPIE